MMRSHHLVLAVAVFSISSAVSFAQVGADPRVPLRDGLYFNSADMCVASKRAKSISLPMTSTKAGG